jgi:hypothetical protein
MGTDFDFCGNCAKMVSIFSEELVPGNPRVIADYL